MASIMAPAAVTSHLHIRTIMGPEPGTGSVGSRPVSQRQSTYLLDIAGRQFWALIHTSGRLSRLTIYPLQFSLEENRRFQVLLASLIPLRLEGLSFLPAFLRLNSFEDGTMLSSKTTVQTGQT